MHARERAIRAAERRFGRAPRLLASAPGRVNLIGEHTDHQEGFVLPLAIDDRTWIAFSPREDGRVIAVADDLGRETEFALSDLPRRPRAWSNYLIGVAHFALEAGLPVRGWQGAIASDVPRGAALSSSAALEVAAGLAFLDDEQWDPIVMAQIGQRAENEWVGVSSGIMDQLVSAAAVVDTALFIDCRDLTTTPVRMPAGTTVVVMDTGTRRGLVGSAYNDRRDACRRVAEAFGATVLRDVTLQDLEARRDLDPTDFQRARHVITENDRVLASVAAADDPAALGALMDESHRSLRDDFEVSTAELDAMASIARSQPACFGARMTGGGFGGAAVALVASAQVEGFVATVAESYESATGLSPRLFATSGADGARRELMR